MKAKAMTEHVVLSFIFIFIHLVSIGLLGNSLGNLHGAVPDIGERRVQAAHGIVAVGDLESGDRASYMFCR